MRLTVMVLLAIMILAAGVLPYISYGHNANRPDRSNEEAKPVCMTNFKAGVTCSPMTGQQAMVMVRGQWLPVRE